MGLHLCVLLGLALVLAACGSESTAGAGTRAAGVGNAIDALGGTPTTKEGAYELVTKDGKQVYHYSIVLPERYEVANPTETLQRWRVPGRSSRDVPGIRVMPQEQPATLEDAAARARKGPLAERDILFKEETETSFVVVARDREGDGQWTQVDGWWKGEGHVPYVKIELWDPSEAQVEWAKHTAHTLKGVDKEAQAAAAAAPVPEVGARYESGGSEWLVVAAGRETIEYTAGEKAVAVAVHGVGPLGVLTPGAGSTLKADPRIPKLWVNGQDKDFFDSKSLVSAAQGKVLLFLELP